MNCLILGQVVKSNTQLCCARARIDRQCTLISLGVSGTNGVRVAGTARRGPCMRARSSHSPPTYPLAQWCRWCRPRVRHHKHEALREARPNHAERRASVRGGR
eukprot:scaffold74270_cov67-Phaeocystis_antarctica.AAC.2